MKTIPTLFLLSLFFLSTAVQAAEKKDPNLMYEGNMVIVKRAACISYGGHVTDDDKRFFMCKGGKYDNYIAPGPVSDPEGDSETL